MWIIPDGLGVRIPGFHPGGPGSIPGLGGLFLESKYNWLLNTNVNKLYAQSLILTVEHKTDRKSSKLN